MPGRKRARCSDEPSRDERGTEEPVPHHANPARAVERGVLLPEDELLREREVAPTRVAWPRHADEATRAELLLPRDARVDRFVLATGSAAPAHLGERSGEPFGQPRVHITPEGFIGLGEAKIHAPVLVAARAWWTVAPVQARRIKKKTSRISRIRTTAPTPIYMVVSFPILRSAKLRGRHGA